MGLHELLEDGLGQRSKVRLLRVLLGTRAQGTGRELARQCGLSHRACHAALRDLEGLGLVTRRPVGKAYLYALNEEHVLVRGSLSKLFEEERDLVETLAREAGKRLGLPVVSIILYGSVARGTEGPRSDVDLLFVVRDRSVVEIGRERLGVVTADLVRRFGKLPQIVFVDRASFEVGVRRRDRFLSSVIQEGRVLHGKPFSELLRRGA